MTQPGDNDNVYIYVSGTAGVRSADEVPGCADGGIDDPNTARFRLEVIKVPLAAPERRPSSVRRASSMVCRCRLASAERDASAPRRARSAGARRGRCGARRRRARPCAGGRGRGERPRNATPTGPNQCHDITVYPEVGLAGGACAGLGLLLDIRDAAHPVRIDMAADANMSFWHSATFSNDGKKMLFTDEWGGGGQPRCRATDKMEWGADALFTIENNKLVFHTLLQDAGRADVAGELRRAQRLAHPDSGPRNHGAGLVSRRPLGVRLDRRRASEGDRLLRSRPDRRHAHGSGGSWSAYWYNGVIVSSEIARGLDIYELVPSGLITENELAAAKTVKVAYLEHAGPAEVRVAAELRAGARVSRSARAIEWAGVRDDCSGADNAGECRAGVWLAAQGGADAAGFQVKTDATTRDQAKVSALSTALIDLANAQR